ncbi:MAG TPA: hypothetical protein VMW12_01255 [Candidatus Dormibacteraeota bacterium]|nr:hypothetical protein [Candidatus Dormibacteraeota bacterium]
MSTPAISVSVSWAISQYRQTLTALSSRAQSLGKIVRPKDPPEAVRYFRTIGLGRNIDTYA